MWARCRKSANERQARHIAPYASFFCSRAGRRIVVSAATEKSSRHNEIEAETDLCDEPEAPLETKETVYRITQEAFHNTAKHARATNVGIKMDCDPEAITLESYDDGLDFDAEGDFPGHLGLRSMRERASSLGGTLEVRSAPGKGTRICARLPV